MPSAEYMVPVHIYSCTNMYCLLAYLLCNRVLGAGEIKISMLRLYIPLEEEKENKTNTALPH